MSDAVPVANTRNSTTRVFYSTASNPLAAVTKAVPNDVSGQGQYHFGLLKKPVNGKKDITKSGDQPTGIKEGVIYSGMFMEDSSTGSVTLAPQPSGGNSSTTKGKGGKD